MKVIGIDVGLRITGYAVIETSPIKYVRSGTCVTTPQLPVARRLKKLHDGIKAIMESETPEVAVYETIFYVQNPKTLCALAQARGVLLLAAEELGIKIEEYTPATIKLAVAGNGRASKYQVHGMVERLVGFKIPPSPDIGDALACALCYSLRND